MARAPGSGRRSRTGASGAGAGGSGADGSTPEGTADAPMKRSPATALVAYAQALSMQVPVADDDLALLIEAVVSDRAERAALLSALGKVNDRDVRILVADLLRSRTADLVELSEEYGSRDSAWGVWTQRLGATLFVFALGGVIAGSIVGLGAVAAIAAPLVLVGAASWGRLRLMRRRARHRKLADQSESLAKAIGDLP
jgi:Flp pilus assembly protein TadB